MTENQQYVASMQPNVAHDLSTAKTFLSRAEEVLRKPLTKEALLDAIDDARQAEEVLRRAITEANLLRHFLDD